MKKNKNFIKQIILKKKYNGKILNEKKVLEIKEEILKSNFFKKTRNLCLFECYNEIDSVILYLSIIFYDNVPLLINGNLSETLFNNYINNYKPDYVFTKKNLILKNYKCIKKINGINVFYYNQKVKKLINKNLAILLPTSGSTGSKKLVKISYENLYENTKDICNFLKINKNHTTITTMPFSYTYGMSIINTHVYKSARIFVYSGSLIDKFFYKYLLKYKISSFGGVPFMYEILKKLRMHNLKKTYLKYLTHAGGSMDKKTLMFFYKYCTEHKIKFISMYGASEATSRMSYLPFKFMRSKLGSIGKGLNNSFSLIKNNKFIKRPNERGEIFYSGKNVFMGYSKNFKDLRYGNQKRYVLATGDLGYFDKDGFYYITGRKNRYVKIYGMRVNLDEIELSLKEKFKQCYVNSKNNKIVIYSKVPHQFEKISNFLFERFKINKNIFKFCKLKKIPLKSNNKIDYKKLN